MVLFFLLKYERPFQRSLLRCDYPRAIKKKKKKKKPSKSLQQLLCIKAAARRHQASDKELGPQMSSFQAGWEPGGRRDEPAAAMNQGSGQPPAS